MDLGEFGTDTDTADWLLSRDGKSGFGLPGIFLNVWPDLNGLLLTRLGGMSSGDARGGFDLLGDCLGRRGGGGRFVVSVGKGRRSDGDTDLTVVTLEMDERESLLEVMLIIEGSFFSLLLGMSLAISSEEELSVPFIL